MHLPLVKTKYYIKFVKYYIGVHRETGLGVDCVTTLIISLYSLLFSGDNIIHKFLTVTCTAHKARLVVCNLL